MYYYSIFLFLSIANKEYIIFLLFLVKFTNIYENMLVLSPKMCSMGKLSIFEKYRVLMVGYPVF